MPFQSEKQRRYLWANEPEIARDWTDTYGSRVKKFDGGEIYKGIAELEGSPINYLGARSPITYPNQRFERPLEAELPSRRGTTSGMTYNLGFPTKERIYDPAFGGLSQRDEWDTSYPGSFEKKGDYNIFNQIPRLWGSRSEADFYKNFRPDLQEEVVEEEPSGIELLQNDFNRNYRPEDANWRTRLRNKGSGIKRALMGGLGRVIDFPLGIMSAIAQGFPNNAQEQAMVDLYGGNTVTSGPMAGYNAASMFGKGLPYATQKRISKREETLQKMAHWEDWRKKRFQEKTAILKRELAKQQRALLDQANQVKTTYHRDEPARQGGQNPSAQSFRSAPGGLSQAQSRAARGDPQGTGGGWKW